MKFRTYPVDVIGIVSLPSWERGLKFVPLSLSVPFVLSLPSWERGLKSQTALHGIPTTWSLPSWERGLKSTWWDTGVDVISVAPLVGAWIEILGSNAGAMGIRSRSPRGSVD